MFYRKINNTLELHLLTQNYAEELFSLTDKNREYRKKWLPWLDYTKKVKDTKGFIKDQLKRFAEGESLTTVIIHNQNIVGTIGYNSIDGTNKIGVIGYWLGEEFCGNGFMTSAARELITVGISHFGLQRIEISVALGNSKSRAIPERLGFTNEGTKRSVELVNGDYLDHVVYSLLKDECQWIA